MVEQLKFLLSVYRHDYDADTQQQILNELRDLPQDAVELALANYKLYAESDFFSYRLLMSLVKQYCLKDLSANTAFDNVVALINRYGQNYKMTDILPYLVARTIAQMGGWQSVCTSEYPIRNTFIKIYKELREEKAIKYLNEYKSSE